jgi:hypothetical protein
MGKSITAEQKTALQALGYTVNKSGQTVQDKDGKTLGGFNENGNVFSGNSKVAGILKSSPAPAPAKSAAKAPAKAAPKKEKAVAKDAMSGYRKGDVTTSPLPPRASRKQPDRPITPTPKKKPTGFMSALGSAIGTWEGKQRKPVVFPESKGTTNPVSKASGAVGAALGSFAAKLVTGKGAPSKAPNRAEAYALQQKKKK